MVNFVKVSSGAVELAQKCIEEMLRMCARQLEGEEATPVLLAAQKKSLHAVAQKLVPQITSSNTLVRQQVGFGWFPILTFTKIF